MSLSVIIIAKNAQQQIADAISSVNFADEVIVIDNDSDDQTVDIAKHYKAKVVAAKDKNFSELRNIGLKQSKGEWILYLDTDERISPALTQAIKSEIRNPKSEIYKIKRKNFYLGNHEWPYIEKIERLFRKDALKEWRGQLHESPVVVGEVGEIENGFLLHYTHKDLTSMLEKTIEWSKIEAGLRFGAGHPKMSWWRFPRVMFTAFFNSYVKQGGWKAGTAGLIESLFQAFSIFITYAKLWEMQRKSEPSQTWSNH